MSDDFMNGEGWAIIGPMAEDIANEEQERKQARKDAFDENEQEAEDPFTDMDDENNDTDFDFDSEADW